MSRTPAPTLEDLQDADYLVNGDMGAAWVEVVERLRESMPALIQAENTRKGWVGGTAMPAITGFEVAPLRIEQRHKDMVLVHFDEDTTPQGIGGVWRNEWTCTVYVVGDVAKNRQQIVTVSRRSELVKAVMRYFLSGCVNAADVDVWRSFKPMGRTLANDEAEGLSVASVTFSVIQSPR